MGMNHGDEGKIIKVGYITSNQLGQPGPTPTRVFLQSLWIIERKRILVFFVLVGGLGQWRRVFPFFHFVRKNIFIVLKYDIWKKKITSKFWEPKI